MANLGLKPRGNGHRRAAVLVALTVGSITPMDAQGVRQDPAGVNAVTRTEYYEVHGRTVAELAADLRRQGPKDEEGRAYAGFTTSPLRWQYNTRPDGPVCTAFNVRVNVYSAVLLPKWVPPADTEPGLLTMWNQSMAALALHEAGHEEISVRYATLVRDRIVAQRAPCGRFSAEANRAGNRLVAALRAAQAKYDADTRHGLSQGTGFPPRPVPDSLTAKRPERARDGPVRRP
jgi:predicted secreted Zn-dependent protease